MAEPRPSLLLILDIDERIATHETKLELNRCFAFMNGLIRTHAPEDGLPAFEEDAAEGEELPVVNVARCILKMGTKKYLYSADEGADERWEKSQLEKWFYNQFYKLGNNMKIFNRRQREIGAPEVNFTWLTIDLQNGALELALHLDSNSDVPAETAQVVTAVRTVLNDGTLGEVPVARISIPTAASYAAQYQQGLIDKAAREAQAAADAAAAAEAAARAQAEAEALANELFLESPTLVAQAQAPQADDTPRDDAATCGNATEDDAGNAADRASADDAEATTPAGEDIVQGEDFGARFELPEADFALDYSEWDIQYRDGSTAVYQLARHALA